MGRIKTSRVYDHFNENATGFHCVHCGSIPIHYKKTSNLKTHLYWKHRDLWTQVCAADAESRTKRQGSREMLEVEQVQMSVADENVHLAQAIVRELVQDKSPIREPTTTNAGNESPTLLVELQQELAVVAELQPSASTSRNEPPTEIFEIPIRPSRKRRAEDEQTSELRKKNTELDEKCAELQLQALKAEIEYKRAAAERQRFLLFRDKVELGLECTYEESEVRYIGRDGRVAVEPVESPTLTSGTPTTDESPDENPRAKEAREPRDLKPDFRHNFKRSPSHSD